MLSFMEGQFISDGQAAVVFLTPFVQEKNPAPSTYVKIPFKLKEGVKKAEKPQKGDYMH